MQGAGFLEQKRASPTTLAIVIAMHAAAIAAILLVKGPIIVGPDRSPIRMYPIPEDRVPPPEPRPTPPRPATHSETVYAPPHPRSTPPDNANSLNTGTIPQTGPVDTGSAPGPGTAEPPQNPPAPVRIGAQVDPRYRDAMQPAYPASEQRLEHEGIVRVHIVIGADGRVASIERLSATSDAFWEATRRQALARWRFRPATEDGRPVQGSMTLTVTFRLTDAL